MKTKQFISNPAYNPTMPINWDGSGPFGLNRPKIWVFGETDRLQVGHNVEFLCNGRGRGGHVRVFAKVTKVNRKTFKATELPGSYSPGTLWHVNIEREAGSGEIIIDLSIQD